MHSTLRRVRRQGGEFRTSPDVDALLLAARWEQAWSGCAPLAAGDWKPWEERYRSRHLRLHSLPGSKQYADTPEESREIVRRHEVLLRELIDDEDPDSVELIVMLEDWDYRDSAGGRVRRRVPDAVPWMRWSQSDPDDPDGYYYVAYRRLRDLAPLLLLCAEEELDFRIADDTLRWLYIPYDGGADLWAVTPEQAGGLRDRYADWLPDD
ncbi:hypothetical protein BJ979_002030 [Schumannella luteola]|uniref:DUF3885 domain-containing protein n=1 Tax=Schumannella luteola TaxID=472059 RepID=A0A852YDN0_9MICO|nr:hypothetical protein [Schumannella luteola]NYG99404.1 hypothetical protein [Schumannella luteola]